ncbi:MAG: hypothetical protein DRN05_04670 [Thermoplasmata archaeon]|nr:MAG: hypothetical protein DRN05_04670 [Thermoplasmata archaeon]
MIEKQKTILATILFLLNTAIIIFLLYSAMTNPYTKTIYLLFLIVETMFLILVTWHIKIGRKTQ